MPQQRFGDQPKNGNHLACRSKDIDESELLLGKRLAKFVRTQNVMCSDESLEKRKKEGDMVNGMRKGKQEKNAFLKE